MFYTAVAQLSSALRLATCYALPVLWMTSRFHIVWHKYTVRQWPTRPMTLMYNWLGEKVKLSINHGGRVLAPPPIFVVVKGPIQYFLLYRCMHVNASFTVSVHFVAQHTIATRKTRDYFDATASNWNTSAHSALWRDSYCIKTGNQIGGWVFSRFNYVIRGGPKYTNFLASSRGMSVD